MKTSMTMFGMILGSTIGGLAPGAIGAGMGLEISGTVLGGILGIWAGLRFNERMSS